MTGRLSVLFGESVTDELLPKDLGPKELGAAATLFSTPVGYTVLAGEAALLTAISWTMLVLGLAFAISYANHVFAWGLRRKPKDDANPDDLVCLDRLLMLQFPLVLYWLAFGVVLVSDPQARVPLLPLSLPWLSVYLFLLVPCVTVTVVATSLKAQRSGLDFVTESVRNSKPATLIAWVVGPLGRVVLLRQVREWLRGKEIGRVSGFSVVLISLLIFFAAESVWGVAMARVVDAGLERVLDEEEEPMPTYEDLCPGGKRPGHPAPRAWSGSLYDLWLGEESGAGAIEGGCADPARPMEDRKGVWVAEGFCGDSLRSYGLAHRGRPGSLLYQQAARFALAKEQAGVLLGASSRKDVREGDLYLIETEAGPFVLVRSQKTTGVTPPTETVRRCEDYTSDNYPYATIPPGLVRLWLRISQHELVWPIPTGGAVSSTAKFAFVGADKGAMVGHAECTEIDTCTVTYRGKVWATTDASGISLERILSVVRNT